MMRMMEWSERGSRGKGAPVTMAILVGMALAGPVPAGAQGVVVGGKVCPSSQLEGTLGISGLDCVGECVISISSTGKEEAWSFSAEPRVFQIEAGSPADGVLRAGDLLIAIDGVLITTREGGRRFANLEPGSRVKLSYRRDGTVREAVLDVAGQCAEPPPAPRVGRVALPPPPPRSDRPERAAIVATAPRVEVRPEPPTAASMVEAVPAPPSGVSVESMTASNPRGRLGLGFSCSECGTTAEDEMGRSIWYFSGPVEVTRVNTGGPAEKAGIRMGDFITAIDGQEIQSEAGGAAFSNLMPGEPVRITLTRRNGRNETVTLVPAEPGGLGLTSRPPLPPSEPSRAEATEVAPGEPVRPAEPTAEVVVGGTGRTPFAEITSGPPDMPVSYSGTLEGAEVLVRGGPVSVSELRGTRTLLIQAEGLWIRIRMPTPNPKPGG